MPPIKMSFEEARRYTKRHGYPPPGIDPEILERVLADIRAEVAARTAPCGMRRSLLKTPATVPSAQAAAPHSVPTVPPFSPLSLDQIRAAALSFGFVLTPVAEHQAFLEWRRTRDPAERRPTGLTGLTGLTGPTGPTGLNGKELTQVDNPPNTTSAAPAVAAPEVDNPPVAQASSLPGRQDACATDSVAASAVDSAPDLARFAPCDLPPLPADDPYMAILRSSPLADTCTEADLRMHRDILAEESAILRQELAESYHFDPTNSTPPRRPARVWKNIFLQVLAQCGTIECAAHKAGVTRACVYKARRTDKKFAANWTVAMDEALDVLECEVHRRAKEKSDRLAMWILSRRRPAVWGDPNAEKCGRDDTRTRRRGVRANVAR